MTNIRIVIPAEAGTQSFRANARCALAFNALGSRLRGNDGNLACN